MITCPGCGYDYEPDDMASVETEVNLRDGTKRHIRFDGVVCCDFWDEIEPGDWLPLASGEEVQLALWRCDICDGVYKHTLVKQLVDTDDYDPDDPVGNDPEKMATAIVCSFCQKKDKGRYKRQEEMHT
jgi:rubredoxin